VANKTNHWKLGLFVVVALAIALAAVVALGLRRLNRDGIPMVTYFDESVQGLDQGSPVKFRGVTIGNVQSITIAPDHLHVEVWMRLYTDELARMGFGPEDKRDPSLRPQLAAAGITGVKFVQFDNFPPDRYPEPLLEFAPPSDYYAPAVQSTLKGLEEVVNEVGAKLPRLTDELSDTLFEAKKSLRSITDVGAWGTPERLPEPVAVVRDRKFVLEIPWVWQERGVKLEQGRTYAIIAREGMPVDLDAPMAFLSDRAHATQGLRVIDSDCFTLVRVKDGGKTVYDESICEVHKTVMERRKAEVGYGLYSPSTKADAVCDRRYPHRSDWIRGGCLYSPDFEKVAFHYVCRECVVDTEKYKKEHPEESISVLSD